MALQRRDDQRKIGWFDERDNDMPAAWFDRNDSCMRNKWGTICVQLGKEDNLDEIAAKVAEMDSALSEYLA